MTRPRHCGELSLTSPALMWRDQVQEIKACRLRFLRRFSKIRADAFDNVGTREKRKASAPPRAVGCYFPRIKATRAYFHRVHLSIELSQDKRVSEGRRRGGRGRLVIIASVTTLLVARSRAHPPLFPLSRSARWQANLVPRASRRFT